MRVAMLLCLLATIASAFNIVSSSLTIADDSRHGARVSDASKKITEISQVEMVRVSVDLVSASKTNVRFFKRVSESDWLHESPVALIEAIRRYDELWLPLISDLTVVEAKNPPLILPPLDVEWVWFCHTLNPVDYKLFCQTRFSKLIGKPTIFDEQNEDNALMRCREIWEHRYPSESFENEIDLDSEKSVNSTNQHLLSMISRQRYLYTKLSVPYMSEIVYLIAAKQRYKKFLLLLQRFTDGSSLLVPTLDILLMWITHKSYPTIYAEDLKEMELDIDKLVSFGETVNKNKSEETEKLWDKVFDQPYEKAGAHLAMNFDTISSVNVPVHLELTNIDVNAKYKSMTPRFLLEVCLFVRLSSKMGEMQDEIKRKFLRLQILRCHKDLKIDNPISDFSLSWKKVWHIYCEFRTQGLALSLRNQGGGIFKRSKLLYTTTFLWNDLLRADSLALLREVGDQMRIATSITPPVQAPYLLKCVPDRVTDDSGAMISDVVLRMNQYRPQEGRWLSRTVLDHGGRECFVVRIRVGGGFWRRGGETPSVVKWEDRIIEIREGGWSYVAGSIGRAPVKVIATSIPKEPPQQWQAAWKFSTGDELLISWESTTSISGLRFSLRSQTSTNSSVKLLRGRKMHYQLNKTNEDDDDDSFITLVRFTDENQNGKATALINWKLSVIELLPEEDTVLILLICISILRSVTETKKHDVGSLLIRRRLKEPRVGDHDWGSVTLHYSPLYLFNHSPLQPWYKSPETVVALGKADVITRLPSSGYSPVEGGDKLYKSGIIS